MINRQESVVMSDHLGLQLKPLILTIINNKKND